MFVPHFWKLSQGAGYFSFSEVIDSINDRLVFIHKDTGALGASGETQAQLFVSAPTGDYFYLTHGNIGVYLLGQFSGPANIFSRYGEGWLDRPFRLIRSAKDGASYSGDLKWWSPNFNSTFTRVPPEEIELFEEKILSPFFGIRLADFGIQRWGHN